MDWFENNRKVEFRNAVFVMVVILLPVTLCVALASLLLTAVGAR